MIYDNRQQAAELLYERLVVELDGVLPGEMMVLSIPCGGVVLGAVIAERFGCAHDVLVCKRIISKREKGVVVGVACSSDIGLIVNKKLVTELGITDELFSDLLDDTRNRITEEITRYREVVEKVDVNGKIVLIVDDGVATGETMTAAAREVFSMNPHRVVAAVPVIAKDTLRKLESATDAVVFLQAPRDFYAVEQWYRAFPQMTPERVMELLKR